MEGLAWRRFENLVEGKVATAAPELTQAHEKADADVTKVAEHLKDTMPGVPINGRRFAAIATLANPSAHLDPKIGPVKVKVYIHLSHDAVTSYRSGVARLEGHGPVSTNWIAELLGPRAKFRITPVIDLNNQPPVDAYEIPTRLREAVHLIHPATCSPTPTADLPRPTTSDR